MEIAKMSDNKREQERNELYRTIWTLANELRGSVDGWDFKQYVLGILFYRYISENLTSYINKGEWDAGNNEFDYAKIDDDVAESIRDERYQRGIACRNRSVLSAKAISIPFLYWL